MILPLRTIGILPALGSGLTDLRRTGQHERLLNYDLRHYCESYDRVYYVSYFRESLGDFTSDPLLLDKIVLLPKRGRWPARAYAFLLPFLYRRQLRECEALRIEQFSGVVPALVTLVLVTAVWLGLHTYELIWWREERAQRRVLRPSG